MYFAGDSYSAVQAAADHDAQLRQQASQFAMQQLASALHNFRQSALQDREMGLRQAVQDWQQREAQQKFGENVRQFDVNTGLSNRQLDIMSGRYGPDSQAARKAHLASATADVQARNFNADDWMGKVDPADLASLAREDAAVRKQEADRLAFAGKIADTGNRLRRIDRNTRMLTPRSFMYSGDVAEPDPAAATRLNALRAQITPYITDPKQRVVEADPVTGALRPHPELVMPWMQRTNTANRAMTNAMPGAAGAPPPFSNQQINSWTAPPVFGSRSTVPIDYGFGGQDARTMNPAMFAAPPPAFGPPRTNAIVTVQTPDGRMWQIPSTNVGAALQRGARILQ